MLNVLVVDDGKVDQRLAGRLLKDQLGAAVQYAENGQQAMDLIRQHSPDIVITDMRMPVMDGLELVEAIREEHATLPVIVMTAVGSEELAAEALKKGATSYVPKRRLSRDFGGSPADANLRSTPSIIRTSFENVWITWKIDSFWTMTVRASLPSLLTCWETWQK